METYLHHQKSRLQNHTKNAKSLLFERYVESLGSRSGVRFWEARIATFGIYRLNLNLHHQESPVWRIHLYQSLWSPRFLDTKPIEEARILEKYRQRQKTNPAVGWVKIKKAWSQRCNKNVRVIWWWAAKWCVPPAGCITFTTTGQPLPNRPCPLPDPSPITIAPKTHVVHIAIC